MKQSKPLQFEHYLDSPEEIREYLQLCCESGERAVFLDALGDAVKASCNVSQLAKSVGVTRQGLYKALSVAGNPSFELVAEVLAALGLQLGVRVAGEQPAKAAHGG